MSIEIVPLKLGTLELDRSIEVSLTGMGQPISVTCIAWLIKGAEKCTIVDTGPADSEWSSKYHKPTNRGSDESLSAALKSHGLEPEDVEVIINTHLHWDHCWGNHELPKARIYIQRAEIQYAAAPWPRDARIYESDIGTPLFTKFYDRIEILDGDSDIMPGVRVIHTPGHTPGHQSVVVSTTQGVEVIAGDLIGLYECLNFSPPWPPGILTDLGAFYSSVARVMALADHILPSHDPAVFSLN